MSPPIIPERIRYYRNRNDFVSVGQVFVDVNFTQSLIQNKNNIIAYCKHTNNIVI